MADLKIMFGSNIISCFVCNYLISSVHEGAILLLVIFREDMFELV